MKTCYNLALLCKMFWKILNLYLRSFFLVFKTTQLSCSVGLDGWHDVQSLNLEQVKKTQILDLQHRLVLITFVLELPCGHCQLFLTDVSFGRSSHSLMPSPCHRFPFYWPVVEREAKLRLLTPSFFMSHWKVIVHIQMQPVWSSTGMNFKERQLIKFSCFLYNCMNVWPLTGWSDVNAPGFLVLEKMISTLALCFLYVFRNVTLLCLKAFTGELHCWQLMQNDSEIWYVHLLALCRLFTLGIRGKTILLLMPFLL